MSTRYICDVCPSGPYVVDPPSPAVASLGVDQTAAFPGLMVHVCEHHLREMAHRAIDTGVSALLDDADTYGVTNVRMFRVRDYVPTLVPS